MHSPGRRSQNQSSTYAILWTEQLTHGKIVGFPAPSATRNSNDHACGHAFLPLRRYDRCGESLPPPANRVCRPRSGAIDRRTARGRTPCPAVNPTCGPPQAPTPAGLARRQPCRTHRTEKMRTEPARPDPASEPQARSWRQHPMQREELRATTRCRAMQAWRSTGRNPAAGATVRLAQASTPCTCTVARSTIIVPGIAPVSLGGAPTIRTPPTSPCLCRAAPCRRETRSYRPSQNPLHLYARREIPSRPCRHANPSLRNSQNPMHLYGPSPPPAWRQAARQRPRSGGPPAKPSPRPCRGKKPMHQNGEGRPQALSRTNARQHPMHHEHVRTDRSARAGSGTAAGQAGVKPTPVVHPDRPRVLTQPSGAAGCRQR